MPVSQSKDVGYPWLVVMRTAVGLTAGASIHLYVMLYIPLVQQSRPEDEVYLHCHKSLMAAYYTVLMCY